jgi:hypothetical protein
VSSWTLNEAARASDSEWGKKNYAEGVGALSSLAKVKTNFQVLQVTKAVSEGQWMTLNEKREGAIPRSPPNPGGGCHGAAFCGAPLMRKFVSAHPQPRGTLSCNENLEPTTSSFCPTANNATHSSRVTALHRIPRPRCCFG